MSDALNDINKKLRDLEAAESAAARVVETLTDKLAFFNDRVAQAERALADEQQRRADKLGQLADAKAALSAATEKRAEFEAKVKPALAAVRASIGE